MPVLKFSKSAKGPVLNDEDWWRLVFDTDAKRLYVEHEWSYLDTRRLRCDGGTAEIEIADFLQSGQGSTQDRLVKLISSLFEASLSERNPPSHRSLCAVDYASTQSPLLRETTY